MWSVYLSISIFILIQLKTGVVCPRQIGHLFAKSQIGFLVNIYMCVDLVSILQGGKLQDKQKKSRLKIAENILEHIHFPISTKNVSLSFVRSHWTKNLVSKMYIFYVLLLCPIPTDLCKTKKGRKKIRNNFPIDR